MDPPSNLVDTLLSGAFAIIVGIGGALIARGSRKTRLRSTITKEVELSNTLEDPVLAAALRTRIERRMRKYLAFESSNKAERRWMVIYAAWPIALFVGVPTTYLTQTAKDPFGMPWWAVFPIVVAMGLFSIWLYFETERRSLLAVEQELSAITERLAPDGGRPSPSAPG